MGVGKWCRILYSVHRKWQSKKATRFLVSFQGKFVERLPIQVVGPPLKCRYGVYAQANNAGTILAATGTTPHTATRVNPICAKRYHSDYSRRPALLSRHYNGTTACTHDPYSNNVFFLEPWVQYYACQI